MELISKVSKGTLMDQIYLPKKRHGFVVGSYVRIETLETLPSDEKLFFYNIRAIEPLKVNAVKEIFAVADKTLDAYDNIIVTGSFLDSGFHFNDTDILLVSEKKQNTALFGERIKEVTGLVPHIILLNTKTLVEGLSTDPLYQSMLGKCITKKRFIYRTEQKINYKILDLHLLKSEIVLDNFDVLNGNDKYYLTRNMVAIYLFLKGKKISREIIDTEIKHLFHVDIDEIKQNMLDKHSFLKKYKQIYYLCFNSILQGIKNDAKQNQTR